MPDFREGQQVIISDGSSESVYTIPNTIGTSLINTVDAMWRGISYNVSSPLTMDKLEAAYQKSLRYKISIDDEPAHWVSGPNPNPPKKETMTYLENIMELDPKRLGKNETFYILARRDGFTKVQIGPKYGTKSFKPDYKIPIFRGSSFSSFEESLTPSCDTNTFYFKEQTKEGYLIFEEA